MAEHQPVDSDVDLHVPAQRAELRTGRWRVLGVIALGGAAGALARFGAATALPRHEAAFPWAVFLVNAVGCLFIGVLMVLVTARAAHPLVRPFLGTGVLGGFTTFSTYAVDVQRLLAEDAAATALLYLAGTLATALIAVVLGTGLGRLLLGGRRAA